MLLQTALFLLSHFEGQLLTMGSENLMVFLGMIAKNGCFKDKKMVEKYKRECKKFAVDKVLTAKFEDEQDMVVQTSERRISFLPYCKPRFKYYIKEKGKYIGIHFL